MAAMATGRARYIGLSFIHHPIPRATQGAAMQCTSLRGLALRKVQGRRRVSRVRRRVRHVTPLSPASGGALAEPRWRSHHLLRQRPYGAGLRKGWHKG